MLDCITFGEVLWDIFEVAPDTYRRVIGGAPANVAVGLARLGIRAGVVGGIGEDAFGEALASRLEESGVAARLLVRLPNRTGIAFVHRSRGGEPSFLFYRHESADMALRSAHINARMGRARWVLTGTSTLPIDGLRLATYAFLDAARREGANVVVDLNVRKHLWKNASIMRKRMAEIVARAAIVKASAPDLTAVGGRRFLAKHAPDAVVVLTDGPKRARAFGPFGTIEAPARRARCVDATGAGDAFLAGMLAALISGHATPGSAAFAEAATFRHAIEVGHAMGALAVTEVGAVTALRGTKLDAVRKMLKGRV